MLYSNYSMPKDSVLFEDVRQKLKLRHLETKSSFAKKHPHIKAFLDASGVDLDKVRGHSAKLVAAGALGSTLLLSPGQESSIPALPKPTVYALSPTFNLPYPSQDWLKEQMRLILPPIENPWDIPFLARDEEKVIGRLIERATGIPTAATLEGERLNTVYGYIGAEQHLRRWPGDTIGQHGKLAHVEGMALGNGGFGYFTYSSQDKEGIEREKYYVAVQTLYLPDWDQRVRYLANWYKWRKVIVVNPDNGKAVVAVIGDAGPAYWTGKHFGGSPEVMDVLGGRKYKKGKVLLYFVDDPANKIPLGEVEFNPQNAQKYRLVDSVFDDLDLPGAIDRGL